MNSEKMTYNEFSQSQLGTWINVILSFAGIILFYNLYKIRSGNENIFDDILVIALVAFSSWNLISGTIRLIRRRTIR